MGFKSLLCCAPAAIKQRDKHDINSLKKQNFETGVGGHFVKKTNYFFSLNLLPFIILKCPKQFLVSSCYHFSTITHIPDCQYWADTRLMFAWVCLCKVEIHVEEEGESCITMTHLLSHNFEPLQRC